MANSDLKIRTKDYALSVIRLFAALPKRTETQILGRQLRRSGTSVGARFYILRIVQNVQVPPGFQSGERFERSPVEYGRDSTGRWNDRNVWNGPVPVVNGAQRWNDWNVWNSWNRGSGCGMRATGTA